MHEQPASERHPLKSVSTFVLEDWAKMLTDGTAIDNLNFDSGAPVSIAWINMRGVIDGTLSIVAQEPFIRTLAGNLLGSPDSSSISEEDCQDAFREMVNVLAGNFLTVAYGADTVFDLIQPQVALIPPEELHTFMQRKVVFGFIADDQPVAMSFSMGTAL